MKPLQIILIALSLIVACAAGALGLRYAQSHGLFIAEGVDVAHVAHELEADEHGADEHEGHDHEPQETHATDVHESDEHGNEESDYAHEDHNEPLQLSAEVMKEFDIELATAGPATLRIVHRLPGEVVLNTDRTAHLVPRVGGIVREVCKTLGDRVAAGDIMAVIESRELAEAKGDYLAAQQRVVMARANVSANEELQAKGLVADLEFIAAERELNEAQIALRSADVKLHTFGLSHGQLDAIAQQDEGALLIYNLQAPFSGTVAEKHIALGELVTTESDVFLLADLGTVWVELTVYPKDLPYIRVGQQVTISAPGVGAADAAIEYISPVVEEATRTAVARVTLPNPEGVWRPGLFVSGEVIAEQVQVEVAVTKDAVQSLDHGTVVFTVTSEGLLPLTVQLGREDDHVVEIISGLKPGQRYAATGAFTLKAELGKESFGGHGHAH